VKENEKILEFTDALHNASKYAAEQNETVSFDIDIDNNTCMMEIERKETSEPDEENVYEPVPVQTRLDFMMARNASMEIAGGKISFLFFPDGTKEFGMISAIDPDTQEEYTIFMNPYLKEPEILRGVIDFNEMYSL